jgi:hypothetical protein
VGTNSYIGLKMLISQLIWGLVNINYKDIKTLKVGSIVDWYEPKDEKRTGFKMGYEITRINYTRGLVWGITINGPLWKHNSTQLPLNQIEISSIT